MSECCEKIPESEFTHRQLAGFQHRNGKSQQVVSLGHQTLQGHQRGGGVGGRGSSPEPPQPRGLWDEGPRVFKVAGTSPVVPTAALRASTVSGDLCHLKRPIRGHQGPNQHSQQKFPWRRTSLQEPRRDKNPRIKYRKNT